MLSLDVDDAAARHWLAGIRGRLEDPADAMAVLVEDVNTYESEVFASQGQGGWAALDPATVLLKGSTRVLVDTGNLLELMTHAKVDDTDSVILDTRDAPYIAPLRAGANGSPSRNPAPIPSNTVLEGWAEDLLDVIVHGRRP